MTLLKQAMAILGTVLTIAIIVAIVAPKTAQAVAAAFVQIQPGNTTHLGQFEGQLVQLGCNVYVVASRICVPVASDGTLASSPYVVPSGYTFVLTDWEYSVDAGLTTPGMHGTDQVFATTNNYNFSAMAYSAGLADANGFVYAHEHYTAAIRIGSGQTVVDRNAYEGNGFAYMQGYLVPN